MRLRPATLVASLVAATAWVPPLASAHTGHGPTKVEARLRRAADPSKASGWSPSARVVVG